MLLPRPPAGPSGHPARTPRTVLTGLTVPLQRPSGPVAAVLSLVLLGGCVLLPDGARHEQDRMTQAGEPFQTRFEDRSLPELPAEPTWRDVLHRAFMANGDLEAAYFEWQAAVERIAIASAYPNSNAMVGFSYALSADQMKTFDRMTFGLGFDSMENLAFPSKVTRQGMIALDQARAAGERFRAAKFDLQRRVLSDWAGYALTAERLRIESEQADLAHLALEGARAAVGAGGAQQDLLRTELAVQRTREAARVTEAELTGKRAMLNGILARPPEAPLAPSSGGPTPREVAASDADLLAAGVEQNPELLGLARQAEGRADALELARLQWIPDINPSAVFTGDVLQAIGAAVVLPTAVAEIRGGIRESEAMLRSTEAAIRQARLDRAGAFVAALVSMRNAQRQAAFFDGTIVPLAERLGGASGELYVTGAGSFLDLIEARGMVLDARLAAAEARAMQETKLAELEALMGVDAETVETGGVTASRNGMENANDN